MHIIYIHQHFCTKEGSSGTRSLDVSRHLAAMGHRVTVVCGVADISGLKMAPWYRPFRRTRIENFDVIICNVLYSNHQGKLARMFSFLWFAVLATIAVCALPKADVVFATSLPLTVGIPGYIGARWHRAAFLFEVRDICPESDVIAGYIRQGSLIERALALLEWFMYIKSDRILLVSPGFQKRLIERGYPASKMKTVLLGADGDIFRDLKPDEEFRRRNGLEGKTVAVYTGAHGIANGLDYVLDAAGLLKDRDDIRIVLIGDGNKKPDLLRRAREKQLSNVLFLDFVPKTELPGILAACDIGLMILRYVGERPVTPNKVFDYMFSGLPTIVNFPGPTIEMVRSHGVGEYADPENPRELADLIRKWADDPDLRREMGRKARETAFRKYDRKRIAEELLEVFVETVNRYRRGQASSVVTMCTTN